VTNVFRRTCWVTKKFIQSSKYKKRIPWDIATISRFSSQNQIGKSIRQLNKESNEKFSNLTDQSNISRDLFIDPQLEDYSCASLSDEFVDLVERGLIKLIKEEIHSFYDDCIEVGKEKTKIEADVIIFCTGFKSDLSFIDEKILKVFEYDQDDIFLPFIGYHVVYRPEVEGFAFVGMKRPSFFFKIELQAMFAVNVFAGNVKLEKNVVEEYLENERKKEKWILNHSTLIRIMCCMLIQLRRILGYFRI